MVARPVTKLTEPLVPDAVVPDLIVTVPLLESVLITSGVEISAPPDVARPEPPDCAMTSPPIALEELGAECNLNFPATPFKPSERPL